MNHERKKLMNSTSSLPSSETSLESIILTAGSWSGEQGNIPWQFIVPLSTEMLPPVEHCTAAFCVVSWEGKVVLVKHARRGFEFPGGHIDSEEERRDIVKTVHREVLEESKAVIGEPHFFGYKKVSPSSPIPHRDNPDFFYPFPHSYVPYFYATAIGMENQSLTEDVTETVAVPIKEALELLKGPQNHHSILEYLVQKGILFHE